MAFKFIPTVLVLFDSGFFLFEFTILVGACFAVLGMGGCEGGGGGGGGCERGGGGGGGRSLAALATACILLGTGGTGGGVNRGGMVLWEERLSPVVVGLDLVL